MKRYEDSAAADADLNKIEALTKELSELIGKEELQQWINASEDNHGQAVTKHLKRMKNSITLLELDGETLRQELRS